MYYCICSCSCLSTCGSAICKLENEAILRDVLNFWLDWQRQKRSKSARFFLKSGKWSAELTASYQCVLRFFQSICLKYCACHEKVRPGHTKCSAAPVTQNHLSTAACNFSSLIWPAGSAPAALASLLFDPPQPHIIGKTQCLATFLPFRASPSSFFLLFLFYSSFF